MEERKEQILSKIGFSKNEAKIYLALLRLGPSSVGNISEISKVHRTNVYDALERLIEKGAVSYILENDTKIFEATEPKNLMNFIKEKEVELMKIIPQLELDQKLSGKKTTAQVFEGMPAFRLALYKLLEYNQEILVFGIPKFVPELVKHFIDQFHNERISKKIVMKHIYNENAKERIAYLNSLGYTEARFLPKEFDTIASTFVCGEEVMIMHWDKPFIFIRMLNKTLADTYTKYFDFMWKDCKA